VPSQRRDLSGYICPAGDGPIPVAFFDADSTLRVSKRGSVTADDPGDVDILPFAADFLAAQNDQGRLVAIVSNQGGIADGHQTLAGAEGALAYTVRQLLRLGARVDYFDFAENYDQQRKPATGMATLLGDALAERCGRTLDLAGSLMVGDSGWKQGVDGPSPDGRPADDFSNSDRLFAENLGVAFQEPTDAFGWRDFGVYNIARESELLAFLDQIDDYADWLIDSEGELDQGLALRNEVDSLRHVNWEAPASD
jgi:DNA 3'-phosphatase